MHIKSEKICTSGIPMLISCQRSLIYGHLILSNPLHKNGPGNIPLSDGLPRGANRHRVFSRLAYRSGGIVDQAPRRFCRMGSESPNQPPKTGHTALFKDPLISLPPPSPMAQPVLQPRRTKGDQARPPIALRDNAQPRTTRLPGPHNPTRPGY